MIVAIAAGEWTHALLRSITTAESEFATNAEEMREANMKLGSIESQMKKLAPTAAGSSSAC